MRKIKNRKSENHVLFKCQIEKKQGKIIMEENEIDIEKDFFVNLV